jgi:hypothetical protein
LAKQQLIDNTWGDNCIVCGNDKDSGDDDNSEKWGVGDDDVGADGGDNREGDKGKGK